MITNKERIKRDIHRCFIPKEYFTCGWTQKKIFGMKLLRELNKIGG